MVHADHYAHVQRIPPVQANYSQIVAVASINNQILTSPISANIATLTNAICSVPTVLVDADGIAQPLRRLLGAYAGGDLYELASSPSSNLKREVIEKHSDNSGLIPLIAANSQTPYVVTPEVLNTVVRRAQHRWATVVVDLPYTCPPETIAMGTSVADHIVLISDSHHIDHSWLYQPGHHLTEAANQDRVTVAMIGSPLMQKLPRDAIAFPRPNSPVPKDPASLSMYHEFLTRLYPQSNSRHQ